MKPSSAKCSKVVGTAFVLATKFGMDMGDSRGPRGSRGYIAHAAEASLRRLRTDVIDFYWYHQPDGVTPIAETLGALHELITAGKVRAIGASNFSAAQLHEADAAARDDGLTRFTAVQNEYSLLVREAEAEVLPACEQLGIAFVPFFPLASGLLTGKYRRGQSGPEGARLSGRDQIATDRQFDQLEALAGICRRASDPSARGRDRSPARPPGGRLGDRRRHPDRAGARQRGRRRLDPLGRRSRRARVPARRLTAGLTSGRCGGEPVVSQSVWRESSVTKRAIRASSSAGSAPDAGTSSVIGPRSCAQARTRSLNAAPTQTSGIAFANAITASS